MKQKELAGLSLEELWQLFPIILTPHQSTWIDWYKEEEKLLLKGLPYIHRISHIGSTTIKDIWAKPTIDILVETYKEKELADYKNAVILVWQKAATELTSIKVIH